MAEGTKTLPVEVEIALQAMPCQAMRRGYDSNVAPHPCAHFYEWGRYHSYDYATAGPPPEPGITHPVRYMGKRPLVPEILSGCRKAPILAVGINPNLPGWRESDRNAIHPYFDDYLQYAHYYRYRAIDKLRIPRSEYNALIRGRPDSPSTTDPLIEEGKAIAVERSAVTMYRAYQQVLDLFAARMGWDEQLTVGEDLAYANMVECPSAHWNVSGGDGPVMGQERSKAIVKECLVDRSYFLRQLMQSLPAVMLVLGQATTNAILAALAGRFTTGDPKPGEKIRELLKREIRLGFGRAANGEVLDARVIFAPHASGNPDDFQASVEPIVAQLAAEAGAGRLRISPRTRRLARGPGGCLFCENSLYKIGPCGYRDELTQLSDLLPGLMAAEAGRNEVAAERAEHLRLFGEFVSPPKPAAVDFALLEETVPPIRRAALAGRVVTMDGPALHNGIVYTAAGEIVSVQQASDPPPDGFEGVERIDTGGVIFPGLCDLHNHLGYNILQLWWPPEVRTNRAQWLRDEDYRSRVTAVMDVLGEHDDIVRAVIRYVEVKLVMGGVTSGQGMKTSVEGERYFPGLARNFEVSADRNLPNIGHRVPDFREEHIGGIRSGLARSRYFLHLAEGTDARARAQFELAREHQLLSRNLVGIHSLGLQSADFDSMAEAAANVVWSPLSNCILYGETLDIDAVRNAGVQWGLGSDWTPSGSRNLLQELKVAWLVAQHNQSSLTPRELVEAATRNGAEIAGWGHKLGKLVPGHYADLLIVRDRGGDVYETLLNSTEADIELVMIGGRARYGAEALMRRLVVDQAALERLSVGRRRKALELEHPGSPINDLTFAEAKEILEGALANIHAVRDAAPFASMLLGRPRIVLELDMQDEALDEELALLARVEPPKSVPLDRPTLIDDAAYWARLDSIPHLPPYLKGPDGLRRFYD